MGRHVSKNSFTPTDFTVFQRRIEDQLTQLRDIIAQPSFGNDALQIGAELEMYLIDDNGDVSPTCDTVLEALNDHQFQHEINSYNIELNLEAQPQRGAPFSAMYKELRDKTERLTSVTKRRNVYPVSIGILPTLTPDHLSKKFMSNLPRYHCLADALRQQRGEEFSIKINGEEPISQKFNHIGVEGANTSFQVHMMTPHHQFKDFFNAAQLTLPLVTAIGANSSIMLGNRVWDETRVALFKQSLDVRLKDNCAWQEPTRVNFGHGWLRKDAWELFAEAVALHPPLLPLISEKPNKKALPDLSELCTHIGTTWPWHRPVYCGQGHGHIRIEFRAIPAGPTHIDMVANAAFAIGLSAGVALDIEKYLAVMPLRYAEYNFYRSAEHGLNAKILWPLHNKHVPQETSIIDIIQAMLPVAKQGLLYLKVDANEVNKYLAIIEQRLASKINGATWQKKTLKELETTMSKRAACQHLVSLYRKLSNTNLPVAEWEQLWN